MQWQTLSVQRHIPKKWGNGNMLWIYKILGGLLTVFSSSKFRITLASFKNGSQLPLLYSTGWKEVRLLQGSCGWRGPYGCQISLLNSVQILWDWYFSHGHHMVYPRSIRLGTNSAGKMMHAELLLPFQKMDKAHFGICKQKFSQLVSVISSQYFIHTQSFCLCHSFNSHFNN